MPLKKAIVVLKSSVKLSKVSDIESKLSVIAAFTVLNSLIISSVFKSTNIRWINLIDLSIFLELVANLVSSDGKVNLADGHCLKCFNICSGMVLYGHL